MTVTKQQQLEWLARHVEKWKSGYDYAVVEVDSDGYLCVRWPSICTSGVTKKEWQQERDKMQKRKEYEESAVMGNPKVAQAIIGAHNALKDRPDAAAIAEEWTKGAKAYMDSLTSSKPEVDNSWHERGELPPVGYECSAVCDGQWVTVEVLRHRVNNAGMNSAAVMSCASFNVFWATDFRPLRTEREKAFDEIAALVRNGLVSPEMAKEFAVKMYDAGLKVVNP